MESSVCINDISRKGIATVELNRPDLNNAYDEHFLKEFADCLMKLKMDSSVRVLLLKGRGKNFQAGADLAWLSRLNRQDMAANHAASSLTAETFWTLDAFPKPTIAVVQGICMGGGTGIVSSCDIVLAERSSIFAISEVLWGLVANIIFPQLVSRIGVSNLRRYALTGEQFDAAEAQRIGLVTETCEDGQLAALTEYFVSKLLRSAPNAIEISKVGLRRVSKTCANDCEFEQLIAEHAAKRIDYEAIEGINSFFSKKKPEWFLE
ncbi:MAG: enoyl-CoA hydratase/isomerase family protein [Gammaproteobacteria bacterium]